MNDKHFKWFLIISIILLVLVVVYPFIIKWIFETWQISGTFGDSYGALNALFSGLAFAGLIITILIQKKELKNQRKELRLQRAEMIDTRKEFLLNRITTLVYNQLERFEKSIDDFKIKNHDNTYFGKEAIRHLDKVRENVMPDNLEDQKTSIYRQSLIHNNNREEINQFALNIYNSIEVLKALIYKSTMNIDELNDLKNIFFDNIGFITMGVIEDISDLAEKQFETFKTEDYLKFDLDIGPMNRANIFLKPVKEFYRTKLTDENFEELKNKWKSGKGSNY